jgi:DNA-binding transcriptional MerR regulator
MRRVHPRTGRRQLLRVGDVARLSGKTVRAIHLYEEMGLLNPVSRTSGGFRLYEPTVVQRVKWIDLLHGLGFSLQQMRELVQAWWGSGVGPKAMEKLRALLEQKLVETRESVVRFQQLERELEEGLSYLEACRTCPTPADVGTCATCGQDHGMLNEPVLVAGITSAPGARRARRRPAIIRVEEIE